LKRSHTEHGNSLAELVFALMVAGLLLGIVVPRVLAAAQRLSLRATALRIIGPMLLAQLDATGHSEEEGVKFAQTAEGWTVALYEDGNGNGIRNADIAAGIDRLVERPALIERPGCPIRIGFPDAGVNDPDTGQPIAPGTSPVSFNRSTICSFSPEHDATPGSVYLTNGIDAAMVRSSGAGGALRILLYNRASGRWE
jgi:type II secretory pathway pseudopilin PulG